MFFSAILNNKKVSWHAEIQPSCQYTPQQSWDVGLHVTCNLVEVTLMIALHLSLIITSQVLSSPLPAAVQIASLLHTSLSISSQCQLKTKHSFKCIRWERKEQKKQELLLCNEMQKLLQRGLVPCSSFPGILKARRDESQSLIFNSGIGSPLETGCINTALTSFLEQIKATMDRNLYIHVFFVCLLQVIDKTWERQKEKISKPPKTLATKTALSCSSLKITFSLGMNTHGKNTATLKKPTNATGVQREQRLLCTSEGPPSHKARPSLAHLPSHFLKTNRREQ